MKSISDALEVKTQLNADQQKLWSAGYLAAAVDSVAYLSDHVLAYWYIGESYRLLELKNTNKQKDYVEMAGLQPFVGKKKTLSPQTFARLHEKLLNWMQNNGYPFALVRLDSIQINNDELRANLFVDPGDLVVFDSVIVRGNARISRPYLLNYLGIHPDLSYDEKLVRAIPARIRELPFLAETRPAEVEFNADKARPVLFLENKKASQFSGIIGFQPDKTQAGKVNLTADIRLKLHSAFGRAERIEFNWTNPMPRTQDLQVVAAIPFVLRSPLGVEGELSIFKKDSIYLDFYRQLGFRYYLTGTNSVSVFAARKTSDLISVNGYSNITTLPPYADVSANTYGLGGQFEQLDFRINPRKGYSLSVSASAGVRKISKNPRINEAVYDSIRLAETQLKSAVKVDFYLPIAQRNVINIGCDAAHLESDQLFSNELFRFGGLRTLRGFDELSLQASSYVIGKLEYRYILDETAYLQLFYNQAWYEDKSAASTYRDKPYGFGAGLVFGSKLGLFSISYALGSAAAEPVRFRFAKVHAGIISLF